MTKAWGRALLDLGYDVALAQRRGQGAHIYSGKLRQVHWGWVVTVAGIIGYNTRQGDPDHTQVKSLAPFLRHTDGDSNPTPRNGCRVHGVNLYTPIICEDMTQYTPKCGGDRHPERQARRFKMVRPGRDWELTERAVGPRG